MPSFTSTEDKLLFTEELDRILQEFNFRIPSPLVKVEPGNDSSALPYYRDNFRIDGSFKRDKNIAHVAF